MASYTPNLNLYKPDSTDDFSDFRSEFNNNMDILDQGGGGGDSVTWTQVQQSGTKIAEIDINGTTQDVYAPDGGGGGGYTELVDIFNGGSAVTLTSPNGVTVDTSSVTDFIGSATLSESSAGYEGFNIALQNLVVDEDYQLRFTFQCTSASWFNNYQYRFGYLLVDSVKSNYNNYQQWSENLPRDLLSHSYIVEFKATATTMYLSFNVCGFSDSVTNYFTISDLKVLKYVASSFVTDVLVNGSSVVDPVTKIASIISYFTVVNGAINLVFDDGN